MSRQLVTAILLIFIALQAKPQDYPDSLRVNEPVDCEWIANNSAYFIMKYFTNHDLDSAHIVLNDWETACGSSEPVTRTKILLAISEHKFSEDLYDSTIVDYVLNYMKRIESRSPEMLYRDYKEYFGYIPIRGEYDFFTQSVADTLLQYVFYNPLELFFSEFYANVLIDPVTEIQTDSSYSNTYLHHYYFNEVNKYAKQPDFHLALFSGIWMPYGNAALLGNHPVIGFQAGVRKQKMIYNFTIDFKFINSPNEYYILKDGITDTTNYFFGGYLGIDIDRELIKMNKHEIDLLGGIGYDGFETLNTNTEDDNPDNDDGHSVNSLNINFGLGYRYYYTRNRYIGLQGKYNFVSYNNDGGTNLLGNCLTIFLSIGGFGNQAKDYNLNELRYYKY